MKTPADKFAVDSTFWKDKRVFITGHTGFKGSWLALWLNSLGACVVGYSRKPNTHPSVYQALAMDCVCDGCIGNIRDLPTLTSCMENAKPDIVFHLAAQALVRESYKEPIETLDTNIIGTANVLEVCRTAKPKAVVVITSDKCYENKEWIWPYRENEPLGGHDPYSASKACAEIIAAAYRDSYLREQGIHLASARAGNVFGGGDWSKDRLIPDAARAFSKGEAITLRMPGAVRPWQHVAEPLQGYLMLARALVQEGDAFAEGFNFGPPTHTMHTVQDVVDWFAQAWGGKAECRAEQNKDALHEATLLMLDSSKAHHRLGWRPQTNVHWGIQVTAEWYKAFYEQASVETMRDLALKQIREVNQNNDG
ncbi:MAG: CDP-glucose 4,6-dehydratase [Oceanidesulfovibrio sp.]